MSKTSTDTVELQRIISSSTNGSAMSVSDSFTHTDIGPMAPLYSTVPEAQTAHTDYHRMSRKSSKSNSPVYQPPGDGEVPNEYDIIPDKQQQQAQRLVRGASPVVVAENVLYGDQHAADQMKHKALTMEKGEQYQKKYSGNTSEDLLRSASKESYGDHPGCCMCQTFCAYVLIMVVFLVALAGLVLSLIILLRVYSVCDCGATSQEFANLTGSLSSLQSEVETLKQALNELRIDTQVNNTAVSFELSQLNSNLEVIQDNVTTAANEVINQRITEDGTIVGLNFSVQLSGVRLYDGCVTRVEAQCTVSTGRTVDGSSLCATGEVPIEETDTYTLDAVCVRFQDSNELNPLSTLLDIIDATAMACICSLVIPNAEQTPFLHPVTCGLQVTRCPKTLAIPANIVTTQTNF